MTEFANAMAVFKLLNKSNCRKCNETTCLAFASKVFLGAKPLDQCPALAPEVLAQYRTRGPREMPGEAEREKVLAELRACLAECDLEKAAQRTGGVFSNGWLTLRVLGKPFSPEPPGRDPHRYPCQSLGGDAGHFLCPEQPGGCL